MKPIGDVVANMVAGVMERHGWRAIDTAPRNGIHIELLFENGSTHVAQWVNDGRPGTTTDAGYNESMRPIKWRPLE